MVAIALVDFLIGASIVLIGLLSAGPLVAGLRAPAVATAAVAVLATAAAVLLGAELGVLGSLDHIVRASVVVLAGLVAISMAILRERARRAAAVAQAVFQSALDCIISIDAAGDIVDFNPAAERVFGYARDDVLGKPLCDFIVPERLRDAHRAGLQRLAHGEPSRLLGERIELPALRADGEEFPVELTITLANSDPPLYTGFIRDITEQRRAEEERARRDRHSDFLVRSGALLETSLDYETTLERIARLAVPEIADWAFVELVQDDGSIKRVAMVHSDPAKEVLIREYARRYPINPDAPAGSAKVIRTGEPDLLKEIPDAMLQAVAEDEEHLRILRELGFHSALVVPLRARDRIIGDLALVTAESGRSYDEIDLPVIQELATHCALAIDNARLYAEAREREEELRRHALHDQLTGLPNRTLFLDRLSVALARAGRREGEPALLFFDLDGFKAVNDTRGHEAGDELLRAIPTRIEGLLRPADTISRYGGDEFAVLCDDVATPADATAIAERLVAALAVPFELSQGTIQIGVSIGIAFATPDARSETIIRDADAAMYEAKREGGGRYRVFDPSTRAAVVGPVIDPSAKTAAES